ncbi:hypothetical protein CSOJ01_04808 [Colletotrichum sojae]|uniref:Uncharacterized protein n=1 Tax=Colletotrichum sojae TaxID=2175907 RepID=A0A8H6MXX8_9PEZI|nr:hypothetical protein CSOJ01_04808 [Colletotrichum sojae]
MPLFPSLTGGKHAHQPPHAEIRISSATSQPRRRMPISSARRRFIGQDEARNGVETCLTLALWATPFSSSSSTARLRTIRGRDCMSNEERSRVPRQEKGNAGGRRPVTGWALNSTNVRSMPNNAEEMAGFHRSQMPLGTFERYRYRQQTRTERPAEPFNDVAGGTSRCPNGRKDGEVVALQPCSGNAAERVRRLGQQAANLKSLRRWMALSRNGRQVRPMQAAVLCGGRCWRVPGWRREDRKLSSLSGLSVSHGGPSLSVCSKDYLPLSDPSAIGHQPQPHHVTSAAIKAPAAVAANRADSSSGKAAATAPKSYTASLPLTERPSLSTLHLALRPVTVQQPQNELKSVHVTYTSQRPCAPVKATALDLGHSCAPPAEQASRR